MALSYILKWEAFLTKCRKLRNLLAAINWNISLVVILRRSGKMCQNIHSLWINWVTKAHGGEYIPLNRSAHGKHTHLQWLNLSQIASKKSRNMGWDYGVVSLWKTFSRPSVAHPLFHFHWDKWSSILSSHPEMKQLFLGTESVRCRLYLR